MENQEKYNNLSKLVEKLQKSEDPKRKYEYILWLGKKLKEPASEILIEENKVNGCVSEVSKTILFPCMNSNEDP